MSSFEILQRGALLSLDRLGVATMPAASYSRVDGEAGQAAEETGASLGLNCLPSQESHVRLQLAGEGQASFQGTVI